MRNSLLAAFAAAALLGCANGGAEDTAKPGEEAQGATTSGAETYGPTATTTDQPATDEPREPPRRDEISGDRGVAPPDDPALPF